MYYHNMAGKRFILPERRLEPLDCWGEEEIENNEEEQEYDPVRDRPEN